jgi:hypothetical protein
VSDRSPVQDATWELRAATTGRNERIHSMFYVGRCERRWIVPRFRRLAAVVSSANAGMRDPQRLTRSAIRPPCAILSMIPSTV